MTHTHPGRNVNLSAWGKNMENKTKYKHNDLLGQFVISEYKNTLFIFFIRMFYIISPET